MGRPSVRLSVCLSVCLSVTNFSYLLLQEYSINVDIPSYQTSFKQEAQLSQTSRATLRVIELYR